MAFHRENSFTWWIMAGEAAAVAGAGPAGRRGAWTTLELCKAGSAHRGLYFSRWTNERNRYKEKQRTKALSTADLHAGEFFEELMLNEERRRAILDILNREGRLLVGDLARHFKTSQVTIRKD